MQPALLQDKEPTGQFAPSAYRGFHDCFLSAKARISWTNSFPTDETKTLPGTALTSLQLLTVHICIFFFFFYFEETSNAMYSPKRKYLSTSFPIINLIFKSVHFDQSPLFCYKTGQTMYTHPTPTEWKTLHERTGKKSKQHQIFISWENIKRCFFCSLYCICFTCKLSWVVPLHSFKLLLTLHRFFRQTNIGEKCFITFIQKIYEYTWTRSLMCWHTALAQSHYRVICTSSLIAVVWM